jgi:serine/threonine-protein kinase
MEHIGRYQIQGEIGRGAMGVVYRALDPAIGRTVAIKTIRLDVYDDPDTQAHLRERFLNEARSAGILSHPGIVTIYDVGQESNLAYIAMEFVNGPTLEQLLSRKQPLDGITVLRILKEMAAAIDFAHQKGIIHRDLKPANIIVQENGVVKITDFGVAKIPASHQMTQLGAMLGTPSYMSPEQVQGKAVDGRSDIFSLGLIAYEMLTGEKPFVAEQLPTLVYKIVHEQPPPPHLLNSTLSWQVEVVLRKALEKDPQDRYATCTEFITALEGACNSSKNWKPLPRGASLSLPTVVATAVETPNALTSRRPGDLEEPQRNRRFLTFVMLALVLATVAALGFSFGWFRRLEKHTVETTALPAQTPVTSGRPSPAGPVAAVAPQAAPGRTAEPVQALPQTPATTMVSPEPSAQQQGLEPSRLESSGKENTPTTPGQTSPAPQPALHSTPKSIPAQKLPSYFEEATVFLTTSPPGANVVFDADPSTVCKSPCSRTLPGGRHTVSASLPGYRFAYKIFQVPQDVEVFLYLTKMIGKVQVLTTPPGASILINSEPRQQTTPAVFELPVGSYTITIKKQGFKSDQRVVNVKDNSFIRLEFQLAQ